MNINKKVDIVSFLVYGNRAISFSIYNYFTNVNIVLWISTLSEYWEKSKRYGVVIIGNEKEFSTRRPQKCFELVVQAGIKNDTFNSVWRTLRDAASDGIQLLHTFGYLTNNIKLELAWTHSPRSIFFRHI